MLIKSFKSFKINESVSLHDIMSKKDYILNKWDLVVDNRVGISTTMIDIFIKVNNRETPRGVYDFNKREFILFYNSLNSKPLNPDKYIKIKSNDFFDKLDDVVHLLYYDV